MKIEVGISTVTTTFGTISMHCDRISGTSVSRHRGESRSRKNIGKALALNGARSASDYTITVDALHIERAIVTMATSLCGDIRSLLRRHAVFRQRRAAFIVTH